jgi:U3 small nucleolar RNA-associated protein 5
MKKASHFVGPVVDRDENESGVKNRAPNPPFSFMGKNPAHSEDRCRVAEVREARFRRTEVRKRPMKPIGQKSVVTVVASSVVTLSSRCRGVRSRERDDDATTGGRRAMTRRRGREDDGATVMPPSVMERGPTGEEKGDAVGGREAAAGWRESTLGARAAALTRANGDGDGSGGGARREKDGDGTMDDAMRPLDAVLGGGSGAASGGGGGGGGGSSSGGGAKADSLAALLSQALRADDTALIERCLSVSDSTTIANTVAKLPASAAMKLLSECAARAQAKPNAGERCAAWARTILLHHAGYASTAPKARATLMRLSQTIESHVSMQGALQSLLGRLELVLHASAARGSGADVAGEDDLEATTTVYSEATDAVDVLQDVIAQDDEEKDDEGEDWETDEEGESDEEDEEEDSSDDEDEDDAV